MCVIQNNMFLVENAIRCQRKNIIQWWYSICDEIAFSIMVVLVCVCIWLCVWIWYLCVVDTWKYIINIVKFMCAKIYLRFFFVYLIFFLLSHQHFYYYLLFMFQLLRECTYIILYNKRLNSYVCVCVYTFLRRQFLIINLL